MTTYRIEGIDYDFEKHNIRASANRVPASWVYLIKPPDDCIGGLDTNEPADCEYIHMAEQAGFIRVSPDIYDEFLRSRMVKAAQAGRFSEHMQERYDIQRARVALYEIDSSQFTWGEWAEYQPDSLGYYDIDKRSYLRLLNMEPGERARRLMSGNSDIT